LELRRILQLFFSNAGASILLLLFTPILTRIYTADDFGFYGTFTAIATIFIASGSLRLEQAIPVVSSDTVSIFIAKVSKLINVFVSIIALISVSIYVLIYSGSNLFFLLPIATFFAGRYEIYKMQFLRLLTYKKIASTIIIKSIVTVFTQIIFGLLFIGPIGLVLGQTLNFTTGSGILGRDLKDKIRLTQKKIFFIIYKFRRYFQFNLPTQILNDISRNSPVLVISYFFGASAAGLYYFSFILLNKPINLISKSIGTSFHGSLGRVNDLTKLSKSVFSQVHIMMAMLSPIILCASYLMKYIIDFLFGNIWFEAAHIMFLLSPWAIVMSISSSINRTFLKIEKQNVELVFQIILITVRLLILIIVPLIYNDLLLTILTFSISNVFVISIKIIVLSKLLKSKKLIYKKGFVLNVVINSLLFIALLNFQKYDYLILTAYLAAIYFNNTKLVYDIFRRLKNR